MFVQIVVKDTIKILPSQFGKDYATALIDQIHTKYSNKVIPNVGLCVCVYELESYGDALLYPGDASTHTSCVFRLVVFRPFKNEILQGKLTDQDRTGLVVSVGFFIDIFVPASDMLPGSEYDENEQVWIWKYEENEVYYENGQDIQVRVMHIEYAPNRTVVTKPGDLIDAGAAKMFADLIPPMRVYATVNDSGLGLTRWWSDGGNDDAGGNDDDGGEALHAASASAGDDDELQDAADGEAWKTDEAGDAQPDETAQDEGAWDRQQDEADDDELVAEARGGGGGDDDALGDD